MLNANASEAGLSLAEIVRVLWARKVVLGIAIVAGLVAGLVIAKWRTPQFTATGLFLVQSQHPASNNQAERIPPEWDVATERDAIASQAMLEAAFARLPDATRDDLKTPRRLVDQILQTLFPDPSAARDGDAQTSATLDAIRRGLVVEAGERSLALSVRLTTGSRTGSAEFVNALMLTYLTARNERARRQQVAVLDGLATQRAAIQRRISDEAATLDTLLTTPNSEFALQQTQATIRDLRSVSQDVALEAERVDLSPGDVAVSIVAEAVAPERAAGARTLFVILGTEIVFAGTSAVALVARSQRQRGRFVSS